MLSITFLHGTTFFGLSLRGGYDFLGDLSGHLRCPVVLVVRPNYDRL
jgi:hypothetical protein